MKLWAVGLALAVALLGGNAEAAKRMGGGKSFGKQSNNVTQQQAPATPATPSQGVGNAGAGKQAAAPAPSRPWGAMLGGLAAGLGLAWLASSLGLGEAFGQILLFGLLAMGVMLLVGWFMRRKAVVQSNAAGPFAFQGAGNAPVSQHRSYSPDHVGNDASARPFERSGLGSLETAPQGGSMIGSGLMGSQTWGIPAGFDSEGFLKAAKANFITLQAAWDRSDISSLRSMMTDGMLDEIKSQLAERETHTGDTPNRTDVVMIEARLLGIEELPNEYMASVEFSGMIREEPSAGPSPFREVWNMTKPRNGGGWLVAGVQALQ
ncbi:Tim44 domain-containing protein [Rhodoferax sp.]|jgi:predicted lipid-binding transport protein (Tim44 family)|uniref:Tim44 domain-containing protein n=1 Tax=Rhodoferax sp. TaxID=50421 RepID=UPI003784AB35